MCSHLFDVQSFVWISDDLLNAGCISSASTSEYAAGYLPLCGEATGMGNRQPVGLARKDGSFSKVSHLTAVASERFRRGSQPTAKTYLLLDAIVAENERTTTHNGNVHTADDLVGTVTRFKRQEKG